MPISDSIPDALKSWNTSSNEFHAWICLLHFATFYSLGDVFISSSSFFEEILATKEENQRIRLNTLQVLLSIVGPAPEKVPQEARAVLIKMVSKNIVYRAGRIETAVRLLSGKSTQ